MLIGITQGVVLGLVILFDRDNRSTSGNLVAIILFVLTLATLGTFLDTNFSADPTPTIEWLEKYFPFYLIMLLGPSIYFLVKSQLVENFRLGVKEIRHYYAVLFNFVPLFTNITVWVAGKMGIAIFDNKALGSFFHYYYTLGDVVFWIHISVYLLLSKSLLRNHQKNPTIRSGIYPLNWLSRFVNLFLLFQIVWLPYLLVYISEYSYILWEYGINYYYIYVPLVMLIYWIGLKWLLLSKSISLKVLNLNKSNTVYLPKEEVKQYVDQLHNLMTIDRAYLNSSLSLNLVARKVGISPKTLSFLLNQHLGTNFNTFINQYRVNAVKEKLMDPSNDHLTIAGIAMNSGFKSIPTFQRSFKNFEHITPKEFKRRAQNSSQFQI